MGIKLDTSQSIIREVLFQVVLNFVIFIFYAFDRRIPGIEIFRLIFFMNYVVAGVVISYYLLPKYLYKKKYWQFFIAFLLIVATVIFIEEAILEKIFYPDTRGTRFLGVFYNLVSTLPTLFILTGFKFAWDALKKQQEVQELKITARESELQFLKSQINPHFLFNNMNNLYAHAVEQSPKTPEIILELSNVLRYMLYECKARFVPLTKEIEQLDNYISLSRLQIEGRGEVQYNTPQVSGNYHIAPLILMVFVENAFKHSASSQTEDIMIKIDLSINASGTLKFECRNTFLEETNTQNLDKGIGLRNVQKRLDLIYPNSHNLTINGNAGWYQVFLTIDLIQGKA
jgi:hypothetical protein